MFNTLPANPYPPSSEQMGAGGGSSYILPTASADTLGGVKVGNNLTIADGVLSAPDPTPAYILPTASTDTLGGVKVGDDMKIGEGGALSPVIVYPTEYSYVVSKVDNYIIKVTKKQDGATVGETSYDLRTSTFPADIDGRVRVNYNDGVWSVTLLRASDDYPAEQSWTWVYNQSPSTPASIDYSVLENEVSIITAYSEFKAVEKRVPLPPSTDGSYVLGVTVSSGVATYSWASST